MGFSSNNWSGAPVVGDATISGSLSVTDEITAEEYHINVISSSISYSSGSHKFGDSADDKQVMTGSLIVSGSGTTAALLVDSSTFNVGVNTNSPSFQLEVVGHISGTVVSGGFFVGDGSKLENLPPSVLGDPLVLSASTITLSASSIPLATAEFTIVDEEAITISAMTNSVGIGCSNDLETMLLVRGQAGQIDLLRVEDENEDTMFEITSDEGLLVRGKSGQIDLLRVEDENEDTMFEITSDEGVAISDGIPLLVDRINFEGSEQILSGGGSITVGVGLQPAFGTPGSDGIDLGNGGAGGRWYRTFTDFVYANSGSVYMLSASYLGQDLNANTKKINYAGGIGVGESPGPDTRLMISASAGHDYLIHCRDHAGSNVFTVSGSGKITGDGSGLSNIPASINFTAQKTGDYTADVNEFVLVDLGGASGNVTITLPNAASSTNGVCGVKVAGSADGKIVILTGSQGAAVQKVDNFLSGTLETDNEVVKLQSDGTTWWRIV